MVGGLPDFAKQSVHINKRTVLNNIVPGKPYKCLLPVGLQIMLTRKDVIIYIPIFLSCCFRCRQGTVHRHYQL